VEGSARRPPTGTHCSGRFRGARRRPLRLRARRHAAGAAIALAAPTLAAGPRHIREDARRHPLPLPTGYAKTSAVELAAEMGAGRLSEATGMLYYRKPLPRVWTRRPRSTRGRVYAGRHPAGRGCSTAVSCAAPSPRPRAQRGREAPPAGCRASRPLSPGQDLPIRFRPSCRSPSQRRPRCVEGAVRGYPSPAGGRGVRVAGPAARWTPSGRVPMPLEPGCRIGRAWREPAADRSRPGVTRQPFNKPLRIAYEFCDVESGFAKRRPRARGRLSLPRAARNLPHDEQHSAVATYVYGLVDALVLDPGPSTTCTWRWRRCWSCR